MSDLPEGWTRASINDLLEPNGLFDGPFGSNLKTSDYTTAGVRVIRLENIANLRFDSEKYTYISAAKYAALSKHTVGENDIIVGSFVDGAVRVCVLPKLPTKAIAKADCFCVRTREDLANRQFVAYQLGTAQARDELTAHIHGATRPRITTKQLRELPLLLPPIAEQRRIIEKVEALLEQVSRTKARLDHVPLLLTRFRQAVLVAACSGKLTEEWRAKQPSQQTGAVALANILARRSQGKRGKTHREPRPAIPFDEVELPPSWAWASFDQLASLVTKGSSPRWQGFEYVNTGTLFVRSQNVRWGTLDLSESVFVDKTFNEEHASSIIRGGDILLNLVGASVGRAALATAEIDGANCNQAVGIIRLVDGPVSRDWVALYLLSPLAQAHITKTKVDVARANFNLDDIKAMPIPLPPLEEQVRVVLAAKALFDALDKIDRRLDSATSRTERLPQAILSKAFSGELVPTEADLARAEGRVYESAAALLERIRPSLPPVRRTRRGNGGTLPASTATPS